MASEKNPVVDSIRILPRNSDFLDRKTGSRGEVFYDQQQNSLRIYDGRRAGGIAILSDDNLVDRLIEARQSTVYYTVTIAGPQNPDTGNKYILNGNYRPQPNFVVGYTYVFDQSDNTNVYFPNAIGSIVNRHPLNFSEDNLNGEVGNGTSYLTGVVYKLNGEVVTQAEYNSIAFDSATSRTVQISVTNETPATLYYWCYNHANMGNEISVADPGTGTGTGGVTSSFTTVHVGSTDIVADSATDTLTFAAGTGITLTANASTDTVTVAVSGITTVSQGLGIEVDVVGNTATVVNTGIVDIVAGNNGVEVEVSDGVATITNLVSIGNLSIVGNVIDSSDSSAIQFTPAVTFDSDVSVGNEIIFPDGTRQATAAGPTPGPQGPIGPPGPAGPSGTGAGDVVTLDDLASDNAIVRYHEATGTIIQTSTATLSDAGVITASGFSGSGASLTALNAGNLGSGTIPDARFPATLPALSGVNLTALNASNLGSGTIPNGRFPATLPAASGVNLTALNASNLGSGTIPDGRFPATLPALSGVNLTALNASNLGSGTVPIERLGASGTPSSTTYLRGDNTWATVSGGGGSGNSFVNIAVSGQNTISADNATDTLTFEAGTGISITTDDFVDTITINSTVTPGGLAFGTISVSGQSDVVADSTSDTLTLIAGSNITITTNAAGDSITIASTASGGGGSGTFSGTTDATLAGLTIDEVYLPAITMAVVTNVGNSSYLFDQYSGNNPTIYAISGTTYAFNLQCPGHPFLIQNSAGVNYDSGLVHVSLTGTVSTGNAAQGQSSGTLYWKIPAAISGNYRYQCSAHAAMVGTITVKSFATL